MTIIGGSYLEVNVSQGRGVLGQNGPGMFLQTIDIYICHMSNLMLFRTVVLSSSENVLKEHTF